MSDQSQPHPLRGKVVKIANLEIPDMRIYVGGYGPRVEDGGEYWVEGWWKDVAGQEWRDSALQGNPAACQYMMRRKQDGLPQDNAVVYGKVKGLGYLLHESELGEVIRDGQ